jgi:hypothetical protein
MVLGRARGEQFKGFRRKQLREDREKEHTCPIEIVIEVQNCAQSGCSGGCTRGG